MWIVRIALRRPYTFIVLALLLGIIGPLTVLRTPTDIFPNINIPVVSVIWNYSGLPPNEMGNRITGNFERFTLITVNNIEHIESQSLSGVAVIKYFFRPGTNIDLPVSQLTAGAQTWLKQLPPGITPPLIVSYNASSVPIIQLALSSKTIPEQGLFDLANNFVRTQLVGVAGASIPYPYGGRVRQVQVDLDQQQLQARGVSADDVVNAINAQNLIIPAGTQKVGEFEYNIKLNGSPVAVQDLNDLPIKTVNGTLVYVHDVAHVRDGAAPQTNIVRVDGQHASLMTIQKTGTASTLDIIGQIKALLPSVRNASPSALDIQPIGDQSVFVKSAISGVVREGVIAAALTALMILLFLGSWRSTLIITISIPLSVLCSLIGLSLLGETINIMTLGGLALAVGILVDDATVAIESINAHLERGAEVETAILAGAQEIAVPALVATLCICIVFAPMFFLSGVARFLFVPLAEAIVFAMLASYVLSRTLIPTLAKYWLRMHEGHDAEQDSRNPFVRLQGAFQRGFEALRLRYHRLLVRMIARRRFFILVFLGCMLASLALIPWLGSNFFPSVDSGQIKLHLRGHAGLRVEETARLTDEVEATVRKTIPGSEISSVVDNIGLPVSALNLSYSNSAPTTAADADILITLKEKHRPTSEYVRQLRASLPQAYPGVSFAFLPADIVSQILNFGAPAPIDIQVSGFNVEANDAFAQQLLSQVRHVSGIADVRIQQDLDYPEFDVNVDRSRAQDVGLSQREVANDLLFTLTGSFQTNPTFWLDPKNGVSYPIVTQTPQPQLDSLDALRNVPLTAAGGQSKILGAVGTITRSVGPAVVSHYNVKPTIDIYAAVQDRDLGGVATDVNKIVDAAKANLPRGSSIVVRGQVQTMKTSFTGLYGGLAFAILLVYLLIVINFQSWTDAFIIVTALPAALAGIVWMLFLTRTPLSVPALTGALMSVGVATANSILVVSFARDRLLEVGGDASKAATDAGFARFRPVLMTALAMVIGMVPMALGLGDGGEQNAPLGRAVIGGLAFATVATLLLVPAVFSLIHGGEKKAPAAGPTQQPVLDREFEHE
ncbi:RND transporter [Paraburkholderia ginsengiterrae]|uniref:RND transporter n=1 Tax=Paraburkholderia ginsengiterrae TaxID=1462993 RepID=A0A1A9N9U8_9BURK|nr:efflux RND transporter permease subunit [Paraburkholderia ginsengiterrae]OAJ55357.1 RND transporter [Paraburkholderia ginsengiterrae]OAJ61384.1 RND transporter [Paraburkholderia ginsengiterrae]